MEEFTDPGQTLQKMKNAFPGTGATALQDKRRSGIPLRGACQKAGGNPARRKTPWGAHDRIGRASQPLGLLRLCRLVLHVHGGATGLGIHVTDGLDRVQPGLYP